MIFIFWSHLIDDSSANWGKLIFLFLLIFICEIVCDTAGNRNEMVYRLYRVVIP